jgi:hypothetical protein
MKLIQNDYNEFRQLTSKEYFYLKYKLEEEEEMKNKFKIEYEKRKNKVDIFEDRLVTLDELLNLT